MSEVSTFCEALYNFSQKSGYSDAEEYITTKLDFMSNCNKYSEIDSILYNLDLDKVNIKLVIYLIRELSSISDKIIMKNEFINRAKDRFGKDKL